MTESMDFKNQLLVLAFSTATTGALDLEPLPENRLIFKINAKGTVTGALNGQVQQSFTEVHPVPPPVHLGVAITSTLATEQGAIEGYYSGPIHLLEDESKWVINGYGKVLSVTGAYADLFLAEVFVSSEVPRVDGHAQGEKGQMTISPR